MNAPFHQKVIMEPTADMQAILKFLKIFGVGSTAEISFCTQIEEWRIEIDLQDMADEGWLTLSTDCQGNTVATIIKPSQHE